jgi:hypothetical protein
MYNFSGLFIALGFLAFVCLVIEVCLRLVVRFVTVGSKKKDLSYWSE